MEPQTQLDAVSLNEPKPRARERLIRALVEVAAQFGYGDLAVASVIERAGVARSTFYQSFVDVEQCFLLALDQIGGSVR